MATYLHPGFNTSCWKGKIEGEAPRPRGLFLDETMEVNPFINIPRLSIFRHLSQGHPGTACTPRATTPSIARSITPPGSSVRLGAAGQRTIIQVLAGSQPATAHPNISTSPHSMIVYPHQSQGPTNATRQSNLAARFYEFERDREQVERLPSHEKDFNHRSGQDDGDDYPVRHTIYPAKSSVQQNTHAATLLRARETSLRSFSCFGANGLYSTSPSPIQSHSTDSMDSRYLSLRPRSRMDSICSDIGTPTSVSESFSPLPPIGDHSV